MDNTEIFQQLGIAEEMASPGVMRILDEVTPFSMVHETGIVFTMGAVIFAVKNKLPGVLLECGTWRGGCSVAMLLIQRELFGKVIKPVYMLDSFEGLPIVDQRDGPLAAQWQAGADKDKFFDNCKAARGDLENLLQQYQFLDCDYKLVRGWFDSTVPSVASELSEKGIAVLRLDGDWYTSTDVSLKYLCPLTCEKGVVIIDDYYAWDGCARALHDYLSKNDLPYRIKSLPYNFGAYLIKRAYRASFSEF